MSKIKDYKDRKFTKYELMGVSSAIGMFFGVGMIMGGSSAGNKVLVYSGAGTIFFFGSMALYLLFKFDSPLKK